MGLRAVVGRAARPRRTGEFSDEGDSPSRRGLPLAAVNLLLLFFLSAPFSLPPLLKVFFYLSFSFIAPNSRPRESSLSSLVFLPSFLYFPSGLSPSFSLFLYVSREFLLLPLRSHRFLFRATDFFFLRTKRARRVIAPRATIAAGIDAVLALGTDQVNFLAKLSCTYRRCNLR